MRIRRSLLKDLVGVETYSGDSAYGPIYSASVNVDCNIDTTRRLVRTASGDEVVSEATLHVHPDDEALFTPESRILLATRTTTVLAVSRKTFRGTISHVEVSCA